MKLKKHVHCFYKCRQSKAAFAHKKDGTIWSWPDITITVSEGASMIMVGYLPPHAALCQHTQNTSATLVSIAMLLVFSVYHLTYWGINLWDYDYPNKYFLISMNGCCCFVTSSSTITNWIIGLWNKYLPSWAINLWNVPWKVIHGMKIHVLLLPDPEEYFFSIYIKFVNEKFCMVKNKLAVSIVSKLVSTPECSG